ncbi:unnamed protein product [Polarella glacialis]|uniref:Uncharacterized protein n=1 Tax=Polarella glacialis TaxID=89957 RepID=A0A813L1R0_POLGL|nr:unnamed protein product [Polarella glacialis]
MAQATELEIVRQCLQMIEQETLGLMGGDSDRQPLEGGRSLARGGVGGRLAETLGLLGTPSASLHRALDGLDCNMQDDELELRLQVLRQCATGPIGPRYGEPLTSASSLVGSHGNLLVENPDALRQDTSENVVPDLNHKLSMLTTGIQHLQYRIQQKSQQLLGSSQESQAVATPGLEGTTEGSGGYVESDATTPGRPATTSPPAAATNSSAPSDSHLYGEALERLHQSQAELKTRVMLLEAENRRLHEDAALRGKEAETWQIQQEALSMTTRSYGAQDDREFALRGSMPAPSGTPGRPTRAPGATARVGSTTPPVPRQCLPPWRGPLHRPTVPDSTPASERAGAPGSVGAPAGLRRGPGGSDAVPAGRGTPRAPTPSSTTRSGARSTGGRLLHGSDSVPVPRGTPARATPSDSLGSGGIRSKAPPWRVLAPVNEAVSDADAPPQTARTPRPPGPPAGGGLSRGRARGPALTLPRQTRSLTPSLPSAPSASSPRSPGRGTEKKLPGNWKDLAAHAYCEETGRPIADRVTLADFTFASGRKSESLYWVNARVRWADLRITERGRVPQRGEDLVLFVLHGNPIRMDSAGSISRANGSSSPPSPRSVRRRWKVYSVRVIRHLPFTEEGNMTVAADAGGALLRLSLSLGAVTPSVKDTGPRWVVHPPQVMAGQQPTASRPGSPMPGAPSPRLPQQGSYVAQGSSSEPRLFGGAQAPSGATPPFGGSYAAHASGLLGSLRTLQHL